MDYRKLDMRAIDWEEEFDGAFCCFNTFGFFHDTENPDVLRRLTIL